MATTNAVSPVDVLVGLVRVEDDSELTICVSMTGRYRVEFNAVTAAVPLDEATCRLLSCKACRLSPEVVTLASDPETVPCEVRKVKFWLAVGVNPPKLLITRLPPNCTLPLALMRS